MAEVAPGGVVGVEVKAMLSGLLKELQAAGKLTRDEARAMQSEWAKVASSAAQAAKANKKAMSDSAQAASLLRLHMAQMKAGVIQAGSAAETSSGHMGNFTRQLGDVVTMAAMGQSPMMIFTSQAEQMGHAIREAGGISNIAKASVAALGGAMGALALAAAAVAPWIIKYSQETARAAEHTQFLRDRQGELVGSMNDLDEAAIRYAEAAGTLTKVQADQERANNQATAAIDAFTTSHKAARSALIDTVAETEAWNRRLEVLPEFLSTAIDYYAGFTAARLQALGELRTLDEQEGKNQAIVIQTNELTKKAIALEDANSEAKGRARDASKALEEQLKREQAEYEALQRAIEANYEAYDTADEAIKAFRASSHETWMSQLSDIDAVNAKRDDDLYALQQRYEAAAQAAQGNADQLAEVDETYAAARVDLMDAASTEVLRIRHEESVKALLLAQETADKEAAIMRRSQQAVIAGAGQLLGSLAGLMQSTIDSRTAAIQEMEAKLDDSGDKMSRAKRLRLEREISAEKAAMQDSFNAAKQLRAAQATIAGFAAAANAMADYPYPYSLVVAGLAAGSALAEVAAIESEQPSFARGSANVGTGQEGFTATMHPREAVATSTGAELLGRDNIARANAGIAPQTIQVEATVRQDHRAFQPFIKREWNRRGLLRRYVDASTKRVPGHREDR